jgi:hypothetical protein
MELTETFLFCSVNLTYTNAFHATLLYLRFMIIQDSVLTK